MENRIAADAAPPTEEEELAEILGTPRVTAETPAPEPGSLLFCVMWERPKSWRPIGHLCLSETPLNLVLRLLSWQTKIPVQDMVSGRLSSNDFPGITRVACKLAKLPLFLAGREELARDGLVRTLRGWHDERGMRMLLIDSQAHSLAQFPDAIEELRSIEREASITVLFPDLVGLGELPVPEQSQRDTTPVVAGITATSGDLTEPF